MTINNELSAATLNLLFNEADGIYHNYAKRFKLSVTALFLLCTLYENDASLTQRQLATEWHYPPQTVNSFLKRLETEGAVVMESSSEDRRSKRVHLTTKGKELCAHIAAPVISAEERAFSGLSADEQRTLLALTRKYLALLHQEMNDCPLI